MGRSCPITARRYVTTTPHCPFLIDPDMARAGRSRPYTRSGKYRPYTYIYLRRGSGRKAYSSDNQQDYQKCHFTKMLFHSLIFKFNNWIFKNPKRLKPVIILMTFSGHKCREVLLPHSSTHHLIAPVTPS
jgi:hypothetical protein